MTFNVGDKVIYNDDGEEINGIIDMVSPTFIWVKEYDKKYFKQKSHLIGFPTNSSLFLSMRKYNNKEDIDRLLKVM